MNPTVEFEFHLPVAVEKKGKWFISTCPLLDVHSQGTTESKARENLIEALQLFIETCFDQGTLDQVLQEAGFRPMHRKVIRREDMDVVAVPFLISSSPQHATTHRRSPQRASAHTHSLADPS